MKSEPQIYNPDVELLAVRALLAEFFPIAYDDDDRQDVLKEAGERLVTLGRFLQSDEAFAPRWPEP